MSIEKPEGNMDRNRHELKREIETLKKRLEVFLEGVDDASEKKIALMHEATSAANAELGKLAQNDEWIEELKTGNKER